MFDMNTPPDSQWHDIIDRLWKNVDPNSFSEEYRAYRQATADLTERLIRYPGRDGHSGSLEADDRTTRLATAVERHRRKIVDRFPATQAEVIEKALVIRDECFPPQSLEFAHADGRDIAKLLASIIALHDPPKQH